MNTNLNATLTALVNKLDAGDLCKAYGQTLRLRNQLLGIINGQEEFGNADGVYLSKSLTDGKAEQNSVTLTIREPLPPMKELTSALQNHWTDLMQSAIMKSLHKGKRLYFPKAFVWIEVTTPRGTNNRQLWDTSNRAVNLIINNLKGVFFDDDDLEHMAFGVFGQWGEEGLTVVRIFPFERVKEALQFLSP